MNPGGSPRREAGGPLVPWGRLVLWLIASRVAILALGLASTYVINKGPADCFRSLTLLLRHWDAYWYVAIAQEGYHLQQKTGELLSVNFFPLYPLLVRAVAFVVRDAWVAAYLVSNASLAGATVLLWKIARRDHSAEVADRAALLFLFNPVSFFYSAAYTESLFLLLLLTLAWFAMERNWLLAGACAFLLSLSRPVGVVAVVLLAAEFIAPHWFRRKNDNAKPVWPDPGTAAFIVSVTMGAAGLGLYCVFLNHRFGDPLAFAHAASSHWHHYFRTPWFSFFDPKFGVFYRRWFQCAVIVGMLLLALGFFLRVRLPWLVLTGTFLLVYLSTAHLESMPRYLSVLFPFYVIAARAGERWPLVESLILAGSSLLLAFSTILFVTGYWFT